MPSQSRHFDSIIEAAVELFRRKGYSATGLNDIVALSGAPKGSLYHYFPGGKASIAAAAIEEAGNRIVNTVQDLSRKTQTAGDLIKAHAALLAKWMAASDFRNGSPATTILLELAPVDEKVTAAGMQAIDNWRAVVKEKLVNDGFPADRAERLAVLAIAILDGALIQSRVEQSEAPILEAAQEFDRLLKFSVVELEPH